MRQSGILMPVSSLAGGYGIGGFGTSAYEFVDFLATAGQSIWQILPLSPTSYGDSPYQSCSAFAGNPYFIDLDTLCKEGLLKKEELESQEWQQTPTAVDYGAQYYYRFPVLRLAHERFCAAKPAAYAEFCAQNASWLEDYTLYMAAKVQNKMTAWQEWPLPLRKRQPEALQALKEQSVNEMDFWAFLQFKFSEQWTKLKEYANKNGVKILGDIPIYVAADSADAWAGEALFETDADGEFTRVAGCPPDYFSADGQLWGNPLYDWDYHQKTGYAWWIVRTRHALKLYDILRIDHFRAFDSYYAIPAEHTDAKNGTWENGPGMPLFEALAAALGEVPIVAEDLGLLFDSVRVLRRQSGFPGMKVLQFAFGGGAENEYLPHNHEPNCVVYPGTHDNTTIADWLDTASEAEHDLAVEYMGLSQSEGYVTGVLRTALASVADTVILPAADWLELGAEGRINLPGEAVGNWVWRAEEGAFDAALAQRIRSMSALYGRAKSAK